MKMDNKLRMIKIKQAYNRKTDKELAEELGVNISQIYRWKRNGFHGKVNKILDFLLTDCI